MDEYFGLLISQHIPIDTDAVANGHVCCALWENLKKKPNLNIHPVSLTFATSFVHFVFLKVKNHHKRA